MERSFHGGGKPRRYLSPTSAASVALALSMSACGLVDKAVEPNDSPPPTISASESTTTENTQGSSNAETFDGSPSSEEDQQAGLVDPPIPEQCGLAQGVTTGTLNAGDLTETSGLASITGEPQMVWAHNDSGHAAQLFAIGTDGSHQGSITIDGLTLIDVEDIASASGVVYLADIGDNNAERPGVMIHRFAEPTPATTSIPASAVETITFAYPGGPRDAEAMFVDPLTGEVVIIEKRFGLGPRGLGTVAASIFVATPPFLTNGVNQLVEAGEIELDFYTLHATGVLPEDSPVAKYPVDGVATGADISADGRTIAVRTYETIWLYDRAEGQTAAEALTQSPCEAPTVPEQQGEAVALLWAATGHNGIATISEGAGAPVNVVAGNG